MLCLGNLCYQTKSYGLLHGILTLGTFHSSSMNTKDIFKSLALNWDIPLRYLDIFFLNVAKALDDV